MYRLTLAGLMKLAAGIQIFPIISVINVKMPRDLFVRYTQSKLKPQKHTLNIDNTRNESNITIHRDVCLLQIMSLSCSITLVYLSSDIFHRVVHLFCFEI